MTEPNQAYIKKCAECGHNVIKLFVTPVSSANGKTRYRMLCEPCAAKVVNGGDG